EVAAVALPASGGLAALSAGSPNRTGRQRTRRHLRRTDRRRHAGVDQPLGDASPSKILGSADRISSRSIRRKNRPVDADAGLYSLRRGTAHLHRRFVCIVGSPGRPSAVAFTLQDQPARRAAGAACRPRNDRTVLRTLVSAGPCVNFKVSPYQG